MVPYLPPLLKKKKKQFLHEQSSIQPTIRWMRYLFLERLGRVLKTSQAIYKIKLERGSPQDPNNPRQKQSSCMKTRNDMVCFLDPTFGSILIDATR